MHRARAKDFGRAGATVTTTDSVRTAAPDEAREFEAHYRARMAMLGAKGGKISGARRMENLSDRQRKQIARKASAARWKNRPD